MEQHGGKVVWLLKDIRRIDFNTKQPTATDSTTTSAATNTKDTTTTNTTNKGTSNTIPSPPKKVTTSSSSTYQSSEDTINHLSSHQHTLQLFKESLRYAAQSKSSRINTSTANSILKGFSEDDNTTNINSNSNNNNDISSDKCYPIATAPVIVTVDVGAMCSSVPGCGNYSINSSPTGLTMDELLDMMVIAGSDPNVRSLSYLIISRLNHYIYE